MVGGSQSGPYRTRPTGPTHGRLGVRSRPNYLLGPTSLKSKQERGSGPSSAPACRRLGPYIDMPPVAESARQQRLRSILERLEASEPLTAIPRSSTAPGFAGNIYQKLLEAVPLSRSQAAAKAAIKLMDEGHSDSMIAKLLGVFRRSPPPPQPPPPPANDAVVPPPPPPQQPPPPVDKLATLQAALEAFESAGGRPSGIPLEQDFPSLWRHMGFTTRPVPGGTNTSVIPFIWNDIASPVFNELGTEWYTKMHTSSLHGKLIAVWIYATTHFCIHGPFLQFTRWLAGTGQSWVKGRVAIAVKGRSDAATQARDELRDDFREFLRADARAAKIRQQAAVARRADAAERLWVAAAAVTEDEIEGGEARVMEQIRRLSRKAAQLIRGDDLTEEQYYYSLDPIPAGPQHTFKVSSFAEVCSTREEILAKLKARIRDELLKRSPRYGYVGITISSRSRWRTYRQMRVSQRESRAGPAHPAPHIPPRFSPLPVRRAFAHRLHVDADAGAFHHRGRGRRRPHPVARAAGHHRAPRAAGGGLGALRRVPPADLKPLGWRRGCGARRAAVCPVSGYRSEGRGGAGGGLIECHSVEPFLSQSSD